jgi:hypothetical protein
MSSKYVPGDYSIVHLQEVQEICDLRHLYDMSCRGCVYEDRNDCPEINDKRHKEDDSFIKN